MIIYMFSRRIRVGKKRDSGGEKVWVKKQKKKKLFYPLIIPELSYRL